MLVVGMRRRVHHARHRPRFQNLQPRERGAGVLRRTDHLRVRSSDARDRGGDGDGQSKSHEPHSILRRADG